MRKRRAVELFSISFLDLLSGALGAVIILYVAIPKNNPIEAPKDDIVKELLKKDLASSQSKVEKLTKKLNEALQKSAAAQTFVVETPSEDPMAGGANLDVGFKFKGKEIVFIIDTSYSMIEEDRIGAVKAGIKMLLTSLPGSYKIEIIQFPFGERAPFRSMWGDIRGFKAMNKMDAIEFVQALKPSGGTPTRDTLLFVLNNYESISDIVLLTDGAPTYHNSNKKDDIFEILRLVREANLRKVQINTIGVGSNMLKDQTSNDYKFLNLLALESKGFFVGF